MRIKHLERIIFLVLSFWVLASCEHGTLEQVEQLMETDVKTADSLLSSMPMPTSRRDRAWYAVLRTQVDYKQYKPITSDSLILTATRYYGTHHKNFRSAMAWYSQGCVYSELKDDVSAIDAYLKAKDLFPDTLVRYYSLTQTGLAQCYLNKYMYDESLFLYSCCHSNAVKNGDSILVSYVDFQIALIKLYQQQYHGLDTVFLRLNRDVKLSKFYRRECLLGMAKYHFLYTFQYDSALFYLDEYKNYNQKSEQGVYYDLKGNIYYMMNLLDEAYSNFSMSINKKSDIYTLTDSYKNLIEISLSYGDSDKAFEYGRLYTQGLDSIRMLENANDIATIKIQYAQESYQLKRREFLIRTLVVTVSCFIILILCVYYVYQHRIRKNQEYYISLSDKQRVRQIALKPDSSESEILDYCLQLFNSTPSYDIIKDGCEVINNPLRQSILHDLTVSFSEYYSFARSKYPDFNTNYINYCILHYLNFSHRQIIDILCLSENNYRVTKSRIRKIIDKENRLYPK